MNQLFFTCLFLLFFSTINSAFLSYPLVANQANDIPEFNNSLPLSNQEKNKLNQGKVVLKGQKGKYLGQVTAPGNLEIAWQVLTDYNNFAKFLPNIAASKIIGEKTISPQISQVIFEQVNIVDLWLLTQEFTVKIAANKNQKQNQINFQIIDGDLKKLRGVWQIETIPSGKILIKHLVEVEPESNTEKAFFYGVYESSLEETLQAIATEINRRYQQQAQLPK